MSELIKKVWINGISGRMGTIICRLIDESDAHALVGGTNSVADFKYGDRDFVKTNFNDEVFEVVIDFSTPVANAGLLDKIAESKWQNGTVVVATTDLSKKQLTNWKQLSKTNRLRTLIAPNTSIGANMFIMHTKEFSDATGDQFRDIEIIEKHHVEKKDSPSGTAKRLAEAIKETRPNLDTFVIGRKGPRADNEIGIHSLRGGTSVGEHSVVFSGDYEEIIMTHRAESRDMFGYGALVLVEWLFTKKSGYYTLDDVFGRRK